MLYPGVGLLEMTNISVGRGTDRPFQWIGAPWMDGVKLAQWLNSQSLAGVRAIPRKITPDSSKHANVECSGIQFLITDAAAFDPLQLGITLAVGLQQQYADTWEQPRIDVLMVNKKTTEAIGNGSTWEQVKSMGTAELDAFRLRRASVLLYDR